MLSRLLASLSLALMGVAATTAPAFAAADSPDKDSIMIGTFLLVLGIMTLLFMISLIKRAMGLGKMPEAPQEPEAHH